MHATLTGSWNGLLSRPCRIHLVGVAGSGVGPLARLLLLQGHQVSGSDLRRTPAVAELERMGLRFFLGHDGDLPEGVELLVYSSAVREDNPERRIAAARGIPSVRRADLLRELCRTKKSVVVAGMHGKTTTTALLAHILRRSGWEPSYYVGGDAPVLGASADWGKGDYMVVEGDESDGTLALFEPSHAVLLNVEEEHLDFYPGMEAILEVFAAFLDRCTGKIVYCADDRHASLLNAGRSNAVGYGFGPAGRYRAERVELGPFESTFLLVAGGEPLGKVRVPLPGRQNVQNALAGIAMSLELGLPFADVAPATASFRAVKRRFEVLFSGPSFLIIDDYAHHPTEIRATLATAAIARRERVVALFQPHRYSRARGLEKDFATAFGEADLVLVTDIYGAGECPIEGVSPERLAQKIAEGSGVKTLFARSIAEAKKLAAANLRPGDLLLALGAGDVHRVARALAAQCALYEELRRSLSSSAVLSLEENLGSHTSSGLGGAAEFWCEPACREDLRRLIEIAAREKLPLTVLGSGAGSLIRDGGVRGVCVSLRHPAFCRVESDGGRIAAGGGVLLDRLAAETARCGIDGFSFLSGLPGTLGAWLAAGTGAGRRRLVNRLEEVVLIDRTGRWHTLDRAEIESWPDEGPGCPPGIIVGVRLRSTPFRADEAFWSPAADGAGDGGSPRNGRRLDGVLRFPPGADVRRLWKGLGPDSLAVGGAWIDPRFPNRIWLREGARSADVVALLETIRKRLGEEMGVEPAFGLVLVGEEESS
ncbi:UDP-N-acetylmuramate dehydrogenase /UDP-N-acetylmuramate--L-alanine ligase [Methylacidimicrobium sp. AP8]|uniref:UDP-N-acetylmuramate--L-alanine ligase n=1 Tax=Methylacidimicrobium sp. AP8 TaxID=2730359 RepID=UPI0018C16D6E|nr:UDP-N-acetylmuramate--L-alanine ligase [Methylacidimicrobium sp. AP8]CAB4242945.1 UDP-N-acetylmuramate dehydrogenase /UDP-N-acetylmuramate--L-alanine ligase [Methylacidimicrobium sp. AP8]